MPTQAPPSTFNPAKWFWLVAGNPYPYSSKVAAYVLPSDSGYVAFQTAGNAATIAPTEDGLFNYLIERSVTVPAGSNVKNIIEFDNFIGRWTNAEYRAMLANRAAAASGGSMSVAKNWDVAFARGQVNLNHQLMQNLKSDIVAAGILTQARADEIFS